MEKRAEQLDHDRSVLLYFCIIFICLSVVLLTMLLWIEGRVVEVKQGELRSQEQRIVDLEKNLMDKEFNRILSDLHFLSETYGVKVAQGVSAEVIAEEWRVFSEKRRIYDQIRFLDITGDEKIRVNFGETGAVIVEKSALQNKKDRYYFYDSINLKPGQTYISKLDLNVEGNQIEQPLKPMIRFATPVHNQKGELQGIVVLNYSARYLLQDFRDMAQGSQGNVYLLNASGYWLSSNVPDQEWGFMYPGKEGQTFRDMHSPEWQKMNSREGTFKTPKGLITYTDVLMAGQMVRETGGVSMESLVLGDGNWKIVSFLDGSGDLDYIINPSWGKMIRGILSREMVYFLLAAVFSGVMSLMLSRNRLSLKRIRFYSEYDGMTQVLNRRAGLQRLGESLGTSNRISMCYTDINGLKEVNDMLGHDHGDALILAVVEGMKAVIRDTDYVIRMGGDEFLVVFCGSGKADAERIWQRIIEGYERINQEETRPYHISVSHGIVEYEGRSLRHMDELMKVADAQMYEEKRLIKQGFKVVKEPHKQ